MDQRTDSQALLDNTSTDRFSPVDDYLAVVRPILRGITETFGRDCEAVLHDFRDPEHSIVAIEGEVTHRHPGGSVTQIGLALIAEGDAARDQFNYITRTPGGRVLKSSTIVLRDPDNRVFGALCINFDITDLRLLASTIGELTGAAVEPRPVAFADDIGQVIRAVIDEEEVALGRSIDRLTKPERLAIFRALDRRGVFSLQRAVPHVAEYLRISRATAYSYLEEMRSAEAATGAEQSAPQPDGAAAQGEVEQATSAGTDR